MTSSARLSNVGWQVRIFVVLVIVGTALTSIGVGMMLQYRGGYYDNLGLIKTGITVGASPLDSSGVGSPSVQFSTDPMYPGSGTFGIGLEFSSWISTNKSFPVMFAIITPFMITAIDNSSIFIESPDFYKYWSYQNFGENGSIAIFTSKPLLNNSGTSREGRIQANANFAMKNLLYRDDRGSYTLVLPFGIGISPAITDSIIHIGVGTVPNFNISLILQLHLNYVVTSSSPSPAGQIAYSYGGTGPAVQLMNYLINGKSSLIVTYNNPSEMDSYANLEALGLLFLGVGVPIIITTPFEIVRNLRQSAKANPS